MGSTARQPELYIDANNYTRNRFGNLTTNVHYVAKLDTSGSTLSVDVDYVKITNRGDSDFFDFYDSLATNQPVREDFLFTDTPKQQPEGVKPNRGLINLTYTQEPYL